MINNLKLFLLLILTSSTITYSQTYNSDFEADIFESYKKDALNYNFFKSMFAIDSLANNTLVTKYQERVNNLIKTFPEKESKAKKEQKRIKFIYNEVHNTFFNKYLSNSYFNDLFEAGTYNCVTATALYVYVFDELGIPYHVKETPTHVYLIAYPTTYKIYLETTVPAEHGFIIPKESEVKKIIDELVSYKLVTQEEVQAKGYMKFYEDFYYGNEFIPKNALIGMQYYNRGITLVEQEKHDKAVNNLKKSKVFFSSPLIKPIIKSIMSEKINDLDFNSTEDIDYLLELISISNYPEDYSINDIKASLYELTTHDDNSNEFIEASIEKFKTIANERVRNTSLEFLYEYLAKKAGRNEDLDKALFYSDQIIRLNPNSKIAKNIIEYVCFKKVTLSTLDMRALTDFEKKCEKYPFIKSNKRYNIALAHFYGNISLDNFKIKNIDLALSYIDKLESILDNNNVINEVNKKLLSNLYRLGGNYYYYKEQHKSAYAIYSKGLTYLPYNNELIKRAAWAKKDL
ncbi:hypothetical protein ACW5R3_03830 [Bizionia sp. KMM 8389]